MAGLAHEYPHALLVPAAAQGHVNGCMLLAKSLAALGFNITFVYFSSYYAKLKGMKRLAAAAPDGGDPQIKEVTATDHPAHIGSGSSSSSTRGDPSSDRTTMTTTNGFHSNGAAGGLPFSTRTAEGQGMIRVQVVEDGFAPDDINKLFIYTPAMKENLCNLILELREQGTPPTCLISDSFVPWTLQVAERAGIPRIDYWTSNAMAYLHIINLPTLFSQGIFPEKGSPTQWKRETPLMLNHIPGLPPFSSELCPIEIRFADSPNLFSVLFKEISSSVKSAERTLIHTMSELESDAFRAFELAGIPAYAIGPLRHSVEKQEDTPVCISWLNTQVEASVIYVAFGSIASLSVEEIQELAMGLEASGNPFLWVISEDSHVGAELPQVLPDGFLERTSTQGLIISWAPQLEVLAHKAIGGFFTHCGWNSVLESMWVGIPLLCCPRFADHRCNSYYICDVWGVGVELRRTDTGGLERSFVELGVKALMKDEEGLQARGKAQEFMLLARKTCQQGGQSFASLQKFYDDMRILCSKPSSQGFSD